MPDTLPGYIRNAQKQWAGHGHQIAMKCPICGFNRMSKEHRATKEKCSRTLQIRGIAWPK